MTLRELGLSAILSISSRYISLARETNFSSKEWFTSFGKKIMSFKKAIASSVKSSFVYFLLK